MIIFTCCNLFTITYKHHSVQMSDEFQPFTDSPTNRETEIVPQPESWLESIDKTATTINKRLFGGGLAQGGFYGTMMGLLFFPFDNTYSISTLFSGMVCAITFDFQRKNWMFIPMIGITAFSRYCYELYKNKK